MALLEKQLVIKKSKLPGAGLGLFTRIFIPKGTRIVEYKGRISQWKQLEQKEWANKYIFYVTRHHVINAQPFKKSLARYANDANGISKMKGARNNANYVSSGKRVFIEARSDIRAGSEILVDYGRDYWRAIRHNQLLNNTGKGPR
jgi:SET domain-containing protein